MRLEKGLPLRSKRGFPRCTGGQRPVTLEDCGGARAYMEEDPRWRAWWDAMPREDLRLIAETVKRFLDSSGDRSVIGERESLIGAVERLNDHRDLRRTDLPGANSIDGFKNMLVAIRNCA